MLWRRLLCRDDEASSCWGAFDESRKIRRAQVSAAAAAAELLQRIHFALAACRRGADRAAAAAASPENFPKLWDAVHPLTSSRRRPRRPSCLTFGLNFENASSVALRADLVGGAANHQPEVVHRCRGVGEDSARSANFDQNRVIFSYIIHPEMGPNIPRKLPDRLISAFLSFFFFVFSLEGPVEVGALREGVHLAGEFDLFADGNVGEERAGTGAAGDD